MIRLILILLLLAVPAWAVPPERVGTDTISLSSTNEACSGNAGTFNHTTVTGTDVLVVLVFVEGNENVTGVEWDNQAADGGPYDLIALQDTTGTGTNADLRTYGWVMNDPVVGTLEIDVTCDSVTSQIYIYVMNIGLTEDSGGARRLARAIKGSPPPVDECVLGTVGIAGNLLIGYGSWQGGDQMPIDDGTPSGWNTIVDDRTGPHGNNDHSIVVTESTSQPISLTLNGNAGNDEATCLIMEFCSDPLGCLTAARSRMF